MDRQQIRNLVADQLAKNAEQITDIVIDAVIAHLTQGLHPSKVKAKPKAKKPPKKDPRAGVPCISGCGKTSLGPRWRYLCADHKDAPKKDVAKWTAARKQAKLDAKGTLLSTAADLKKFNGRRVKNAKSRMNGHSLTN
jgi:hypothetical protein